MKESCSATAGCDSEYSHCWFLKDGTFHSNKERKKQPNEELDGAKWWVGKFERLDPFDLMKSRFINYTNR